MSIISTWRRAVNLFAPVALAALLAGCVVSSEVNLVAPQEAAIDLLPASFQMTTYEERDGVFVKSDDAPGTFTLEDGGYVAPDGSMTAYFIGIEDQDYYLLAIVAGDGAMYGAAAMDGHGILEIRMILEGDPAAAGASLPATVVIADGGIRVASRADLEAVVAAIANGTLPTTPLVAYVGTGTPPTSLARDGDWYKAE
jgi:hypothetical protein